MLKKIFFAAVIAVLSGCCCTKNNTPATESDANETFEIGGRVVEAVISGNFSDFAAAAGENSSEKTAKEFSESRKELIRNYGELCSFRRFGRTHNCCTLADSGRGSPDFPPACRP